ncbi:hypothetical protein L1049_018846 [Liquidambar formosana]|uniref:Phosphorylated adapter RNA export protein n=1 Tax=Liquidambar formosana TaxID=63359 RepID=A0AAP0RAM9_LIQFO
MEGGESILDAIYEEDNLEDVQDVEMFDVEEGEFVVENSCPELGSGDVKIVNQESCNANRKRKRNKKNRKKKSGSAPNVTDVNRFVLDTCRRLKEKKSYMVYTAVGCMGVSALSDLIKEVDAIEACGGQMTADGRRRRTGGGILWNIIKIREPKAYKEIMKRAQEFEKQFKQQNIRPAPKQNCKASSQGTALAFPDGTSTTLSDGSQPTPQMQGHIEQSNGEGKRASVHDRIRVPVSYDDLLGDDPKDKPS